MDTNLKKLREQYGYTQQQLADVLGVTRQAYNHYETGRRSPPTQALLKLAEHFSCTVDTLMNHNGRDEAEPTPIPVLGSIRAGFEHEVAPDYEGYERIDVPDPEEYFLLEVEGDAMEPEIYEGDRALIHRQDRLRTGEVALVRVGDGEPLLRRVLLTKTEIVLEPFNEAYETIRLPKGSRFTVLGRVEKTMREW